MAAQGERQGEKTGRRMWSSGRGNTPFPGLGGGSKRSGKGHQRVRSWSFVCGVGYVAFEFVEGAVVYGGVAMQEGFVRFGGMRRDVRCGRWVRPRGRL